MLGDLKVSERGGWQSRGEPRLLAGTHELMVVPVISVVGYMCYISRVTCSMASLLSLAVLKQGVFFVLGTVGEITCHRHLEEVWW